VLGDPVGLEQILVNLAVNARDAMRSGGKLRIATTEIELSAATGTNSSTLPPGRYVQLVVADSGCGMAPEIQEHAFEPYFTTTLHGDGSGLGLFNVKGIVERLGGALNLQSQPGRGTRLAILLPLDARATGRNLDSIAAHAETLTINDAEEPLTILVVEDESMTRRAVTQMLSQHSVQVLTAESPDRALEVAKSHDGPIDLLLSDIVLPGGNGGTLAEAIRELRPGVRVVFMSAYPAHVLAEQGLLPPETPSLEKPFDARQLAHALRAVMQPVGVQAAA
jgi:two-component system cell cycle sensor histidine kinase/response regulator CckA